MTRRAPKTPRPGGALTGLLGLLAGLSPAAVLWLGVAVGGAAIGTIGGAGAWAWNGLIDNPRVAAEAAAAERSKCHEKELEAEIDRLKRDAEIAKAAEATAKRQAQGLADRAATLKKRMTDYEAAIANDNGHACIATDADVRRLLDLVR